MAPGFYVHIPFCRQACRYCDFHFAVSLGYMEDMILAMQQEIIQKAKKFDIDEFETLYFGGGTPSVFSIEQLGAIMDGIRTHFRFKPGFEVCVEANPDDLTEKYLAGLKELGADRLSIGIQSFREEDLKLMRRSHSAGQAIQAITRAQKNGFKNINADLIYGIPGMSNSDWEANLKNIFSLGVQHISAYHLTFEPGTIFDHWKKKKKIIPVDENVSVEQFEILREQTAKNGFIHYEISNFALPGYYSKHNTSYWKNQKYIGIGPSAHSYDGNARFWNIRSNRKYMDILHRGGVDYYETETLSERDLYNEYVLTSLRTIWGMDMNEIFERFGDNYVKYTARITQKLLDNGQVTKKNQKITISEQYLFLADRITGEYFKV